MKIKKHITIRATFRCFIVAFAFICNSTAFSQCVITMDGAVNIDVPSGTFLGVTGDVVLQNATPAFDNKGTVHITGNWTNNASAGAGFVTSGVAPATTGTCILEGAAQTIGGTTKTTFYNLTLAGTANSVKTASINTDVNFALALNDHEFAIGSNVLTMLSGTSANLTWTAGSGFISMTSGNSGGYFARATNSTATYEYPLGIPGGTKFRPIQIAPATTTANTWKVRLNNNSPTADGYSASSTDGVICSPLSVTFYYNVARTAADNATLTMYFKSAIDGVFTKMAHWQGAPVWTTMDPGITSASGTYYGASALTDYVQKTAWNNWTYEYFALANPGLPAVVTANAATNTNCTTFTANWNAATNAFSYYFDLSTSNSFGSFVGSYNALNTGSVTTLNLTGLTAGTQYYYRLRSWNGCGTQPTYSNIISFTTPTATVAPTTLSASNNPVCSTSSSTTLTQSGGTLGTGASWEWHTNNTYTALVNTNTNANASYSPAPGSTTTYWLRATSGSGYTCTPTTNGPVAGVTVTVRQPITGTFTYTNPTSCSSSNGAITVSGVSGGSGAYNYSSNGSTYQASPSFTTIASGTSNNVYVRNSDNAPGCPVSIGSYTMNQPYTPISAPTLANNLPDLCTSNIATLTVSGMAPGNGGSNAVNGAYSFNGSQYLGNSTSAGLPTGSIATAEAWIKPTGTYGDVWYNGIVTWGTHGCTATTLGFCITNTGRLNVAGWCNDVNPTTGASVVPNVWSHVAVVVNGTSIIFYINGQVALNTTFGALNITTGAGNWLTIGCLDGGGGRFFNGEIDNVRIWASARTQAELQADMYRDMPTTNTAGLRAVYTFNGGSLANSSGTGPALTSATAVVSRPLHYTYTFTGATPSGSNPAVGTNEVVTTGALAGTSPFQVTASFNGCSSTQSNTAASNDFGGAYTVAFETAGTGNAVNVVLPGSGSGNAYGHAAGTGYGETGIITATGGGAWDRCVNWGMPIVSTASSGPRISFGPSLSTTMTYLANGQPNSTTNLGSGIVCYTATLAVPTNYLCSDAVCSGWYTGNITVRLTLTTLNASNVAIPLDYTSSGHIMMRAAQNFKIRQKMEVLVPASGIQYYSCGSYSSGGTWQPLLDWYDCAYKNPTAAGFYYSFNYNSFPKFTFTSGISAGNDVSLCTGGTPVQKLDLSGSLGSLSSTCGALLHYWDGPSSYVNAGTLLAPTGVQDPASFNTSTSPTTFGTYNYTVSQGPVGSSNICYMTDAMVVSVNGPVADPTNFPAGTYVTTNRTTWTGGVGIPAEWNPPSSTTNDNWFDNRNWSNCVPTPSVNALINYVPSNQPQVTSNSATANGIKTDTPSGAKTTINVPAGGKITVTR